MEPCHRYHRVGPGARRGCHDLGHCPCAAAYGGLATIGQLRATTSQWAIASGQERPLLFAVAALNAITGVAAAILLAPVALGADASFYRGCGEAALSGRICESLYPPLTSYAAVPLTLLPPALAGLLMSLIGALVLGLGIRRETAGRPSVDRALVAVAAFGFAPIVYELLLGQVTLLTAASLYPVVRWRDSGRHGIAFGVVLALAPKPMLVFVLLWMLVWRRKALAGAALTWAALTGVGVLLVGMEGYLAWVSGLLGAGTLGAAISTLSVHGNMSLWPLSAPKAVVALAAILAAVYTIARDPDRGLIAAIVAGLMVAPYTGLYAVSLLLLVAKPALRVAPVATRLFALAANLCLLFVSGLVVLCATALLVLVPRRRPLQTPAP